MGNNHSRGRFSDSDEEYENWHTRQMEKEQRSFYDSDASDESEESMPNEPPSKRRKKEKRFKYGDENDDEEDCEYEVLDYELEGTKLKIRNCSWRIDGFEGTDVVEKKGGFIRSNLYVSGPCNLFQFYLIMFSQVTEDDTQYGVYSCVLSNIRSNAKVFYESVIFDYKNRKSLLDKKNSECPKKPGLRFLGYLSKEEIINDDYNNARYLEDGDLNLAFKVDVEYKSLDEVRYLEKLFDQNQVKDVVVEVKGQKLPANRKILSQESETFAKLFQKNKSNKIEINDIDPEVMKSLLSYMHARKIPNLFTYADELSAAAHKYKLKDLKTMCKKLQS